MSGFERLFAQTRRRLRQRPFRPHWLLRGGHAQTLVVSRMPRTFEWDSQPCRREEVEVGGGRFLVRTVAADHRAPALIVLHGMSGDSSSGYMQGLSYKAHRLGWRSFLPDLYDISDQKPPVIFHAGASRAAGGLIRSLVRRHRLDRVYLAGVSMGANILLKMLAEWRDDLPDWLMAAAVFSPLCDLESAGRLMERPSNRLYRIYFVNRLKNVAERRRDCLESLLDWDALQKIRTIRRFDELYTVPLSRYKNVSDYYQQASSSSVLDRIRLPMLVIHSRDDPILPWTPLAGSAASSNPHLLVHLTERGGHVGFFEQRKSVDCDRFWAENRLIEFFRDAESDLSTRRAPTKETQPANR